MQRERIEAMERAIDYLRDRLERAEMRIDRLSKNINSSSWRKHMDENK